MNRLADATSPYLLQHADNPVEWWEWGAAAFEEARRRDVPVLISVGYAACHWCHVMAHGSFEDPAVAELVNAATVPIKVDREERPDVDAVYMTATQAMTGQGGWPMTVFATPDGAPFWCGTYLPKPQFTELVRAVAEAWAGRRDEVVGQGARLVAALRRAAAPAGGGQPLTADLLTEAAVELRTSYDRVNGGFGTAPKFPPSMVLAFLLRHHARTGDAASLAMVRHTCDRMARGGMYDQLAGGFARYSVDATWTVPHFEKMLYDNALLLRVYTSLWRATGDPSARRVAGETARFLLDDLRVGDGFAASLDADTDGVEGSTYAWTPAQLTAALGADDGAWATELLQVTGTFEGGSSVLSLPADPADTERWARVRAALHRARSARPQPARDDKVVSAWNGLAITALVEYAELARSLRNPAASNATPDAASGGDAVSAGDGASGGGAVAGGASAGGAAGPGAVVGPSPAEALGAAFAAGRLLRETHLVDGRLRRVSRNGVVGVPVGVLEDYGCVAQAFCALHQVDTGADRPGWLTAAGTLLDAALLHFRSADSWYDTADDAETLVSRPADPTDGASPSGLSAVAEALTSYAALSGADRYRSAAELAVAVLAPVVARQPRFAGHALSVGEALLSGPYQVAVVGAGAAADALRDAARRSGAAGAVVVAGAPDEPGVPLLADRPLVAGGPAAYVCRGFVCDRPVTTAAELWSQLTRPAREG